MLFLLALALFVPISYRLKAAKATEDFSGSDVRADVRWLFGAIRVTYDKENPENATVVRIFGIRLGKRIAESEDEREPNDVKEDAARLKKGRVKKEEKGEKEEKAKKEKEQKEKVPFRKRIEAIRASIAKVTGYPYKKQLVGLVFKLIKRFIRPFKRQKLRGEVIFGFDDPSQTGMAIGMTYAVGGFLNYFPPIALRGDFEGKALFYDVSMRGRFYLWSFTWPIIALVCSKPVRAIIKEYLSKNKKTK